MRHFGARQNLFEESAIVNQELRPSFDERLESLVTVCRQTDQVIQEDQRRRGNETPDQGVVAAVHRVLNGVGENEQQNEVERSELSHLPFPRETKQNQEEDVDDKAAKDEL